MKKDNSNFFYISYPQPNTIQMSTLENPKSFSPQPDPVNHPSHYTNGIEVIDILKSKLTPEEFRGYCKGNILKYIFRCDMKGGMQDLEKAKWYLNKLLEQQ